MSASKRHLALALLALAHLLAGAAAVYVTYDHREIEQVFPFGIVFASNSMLAIWIGLGTASPPIRLAGAVIGVLCTSFLYMLFRYHRGVDFGEWFDSALLMSSIAAFVAGPLLVLRRRSIDLSWIGVGQASSEEKPFQFSLRRLLLLTLAIGVVCSVARVSHSAFATPGTSHNVREIFYFLDHSLGFAAATGAVLWMTLGRANPLFRCPAAILAAGANGLLLSYGFDRTSLISLMAWGGVAASHATCVAVSLLVVRLCGYRLLHRASPAFPINAQT